MRLISMATKPRVFAARRALHADVSLTPASAAMCAIQRSRRPTSRVAAYVHVNDLGQPAIKVRLGSALLIPWQVATATVALKGFEGRLAGYYLRGICLDFRAGLVCAGWLRRPRNEVVLRRVWSALLTAGLASFAVGVWFDAATSRAAILCAAGGAPILIALVRLD